MARVCDPCSKQNRLAAAVHKLARIVYRLMRYGAAYVRQEEEANAAQVRARLYKQLTRRARELGYELKKVEPASGTEPTGGYDARSLTTSRATTAARPADGCRRRHARFA